MNTTQEIKNRIIEGFCQLHDRDPNQALALATRLFVELGIESVEVTSNKDRDILIGPMLGRNITIHKPKKSRKEQPC